MPKVTNTRKQRANELLARIKRGPSSIDETHEFDGSATTAEQRRKRYNTWFESWVRCELIDLIPELRKQHATQDN